MKLHIHSRNADFDETVLVTEIQNLLHGAFIRLHLDEHNRIRRELDWAQIRNGAPNALSSP